MPDPWLQLRLGEMLRAKQQRAARLRGSLSWLGSLSEREKGELSVLTEVVRELEQALAHKPFNADGLPGGMK